MDNKAPATNLPSHKQLGKPFLSIPPYALAAAKYAHVCDREILGMLAPRTRCCSGRRYICLPRVIGDADVSLLDSLELRRPRDSS